MAFSQLPNELKLRIARACVPSVVVAKATCTPYCQSRKINLIALDAAEICTAMSWLSLSFSHQDILDELEKKDITLRIEVWRTCEKDDLKKAAMNVDTGILAMINKIEIVDMEINLFDLGDDAPKGAYINPREKSLTRTTINFTRDENNKLQRDKIIFDSFLTPDLDEVVHMQKLENVFSRSWTSYIRALQPRLHLTAMLVDYRQFDFQDTLHEYVVSLRSHTVTSPLLLNGWELEPRARMDDSDTTETLDRFSKKDLLEVYNQIEEMGEMEWVRVHEHAFPPREE